MNLKYLLVSVASASLGYLAAHVVLKNKHEASLNEATADAQEYYREYYKNKASELDSLDALVEKTKEYWDTDGYMEAVMELQEYSGVEGKLSAENSERYSGTTDFDVEELLRNEQIRRAPDPKVDYNAISKKRAAAAKKALVDPIIGGTADEFAPFVISESEYNIGKDDYNESVTLVYYSEDDILAYGLNGEIMPEERLEQFITRGNLEKFGDNSSDEHTLYVRCHSYKIDFEIVREMAGYTEITGLPLPQRGGGDE